MKRACFLRLGYFPAEEHLRKNASALVEAGYRVDVLCLRRLGERAMEPYWGGTVYRLPLMHRRSGLARHLFEHVAFCLLSALVLPVLFLRRRYRVVEVYGPPDYAIFAALLPRLLGARLVLYIFDPLPETLVSHLQVDSASRLVRLATWLERASTALAQQVVVVSPYHVRALSERGTPRRKLAWLPNAPDEAVFLPRERPGPPLDGFVVVTHGTLLERYGIDEMVRAAALLRSRIPGLKVRIIGEGEHRPAAEALARSLGLDGVVEFAGWLPYGRVAAEVLAAHVGVVPVRFNSLPNKVFEYALLGRPVVAAGQPAISCVFGPALLYFPPGDASALAEALFFLYQDVSLRQRLADAARAVAERHAWVRAKAAYVELHERPLGQAAWRAGPERTGG